MYCELMARREKDITASDLTSDEALFRGPLGPIVCGILDATRRAPEPIRRILWGVRTEPTPHEPGATPP
ncbi:hypothetical protein AWC31_09440 [Mycolicibacterium wolinskyi]|uniref:Uncharacterized protein n=2 Tax=Mycobacteriaceae TaxID=1762 RepID=A0A1X2ESV6_9MYCO|nr:hypothetical protein AWC31_09440 [Mycolicibacterium wolinskyi]